MRKGLISAIACFSLAALPISSTSATENPNRDRHHGRQILTFDTMYGVDGPFVGEGFAIRGIPGDELPWVVRSAEGSLDTHGRLRITIRGLVFKDTPAVPAELRGINDELTFRGLVSCLTEEGEEHVVTANVITRGFRATRRGNADIHATVNLPNPCVGAIIMVLAGSEDKWFAVNGFESE